MLAAKKWSLTGALLYKKSPSPPLPSSLDTHWPRTCCSRLRITFTACCSMINLVCGFSLLRWSWHMRPSSLKASLMSRTRSRSRVLFANLRNFSRSALISTGRSSSSSPSRLVGVRWQIRGGRTQQYGYSSLQVTFWRAINFLNNSTDQEPSSVPTLCGERAMVPGKGSVVRKG